MDTSNVLMDSQPQKEIEGSSGDNKEVDLEIEGSEENEKSNKRSPKWEGENNIQHSKLYKTAESIIKDNPDALTAPIEPSSEIVLHVAVRTGSSVQFVRNLFNKMPSNLLEIGDGCGDTALHLAASVGNTKIAEILVKNCSSGDKEIHSEIEGSSGNKEIHSEIEGSSGNKEIRSAIEGSSGNKELHSEIEGSSGNKEIHSEIEGSSGNKELHSEIQGSSGDKEIHSQIEGNKGNEKSNERSPKCEGENNGQLLKLYKAAIHGDWKTAESIIKENPDALTAPIGPYSEIALHVAVKTGRSVQFVQNLVKKMSSDSLEKKDKFGETALHHADKFGQTALHQAAYTGNTKAAKILVENNSILPQRMTSYGYSALHIAALYGHKETVSYLLSVTRDVEPSPFAAETGVLLLNFLIISGFYDMVSYLLKRYPKLALEKDEYGRTPLKTLAGKPHAFESGTRLGRGQRLIYHIFVGTGVDNKNNPPPKGDIENYVASHQSPEGYLKASKPYRFIQHIQNTMLMHKQAMELLRILIDAADSADLIANQMFEAAELGITEIVVEAVKAYPYLIRYKKDDKKETVFHVAVLHRQEKIYNLLYQMGSQKTLVASHADKYYNNLLHKAGELGSSDRISGAALQMQRELQWFKEVEMTIRPSGRENKNNNGKTPRMLFTESHKDLVKEGEKWMKDTASSFALVAALIVTVVFAAAFTVPGGNNSEGIPIYMNQTPFLIFAISDILALFSSITSLLMFLGILIARYAEEDFLLALPMRLCIGLITLFFSMAAMLVAFSASFYIVLAPRLAWIVVPIGILASIPVILFAFLQFPLLVQIVAATFGPSIFGRQSDEIIC